MQIKTIQKNISNKLTEWLETIKDEQLKKDLKNNILVSGGSITSMLLNEQVNDYDIYIKDKSVLMRLVKYYTLLMFTDSRGGLKIEYPETENPTGKYLPTYFSPNAISLTDNIQIVIRFYGDNEAIHKTFDFVHATNYFTFETGLVTNLKALESILTKQLFYQGSQYPLTSIIRMKKFVKRGWNINAGEILKIMFQISELDLKNPDVLEEQLIGIDVAYFTKLIEILRDLKSKDKDEKITSPYLNAIIDKVFNSADETE